MLESQTPLATNDNVHVSLENHGADMALNLHHDTLLNAPIVMDEAVFTPKTNTTPMTLDAIVQKGEQKLTGLEGQAKNPRVQLFSMPIDFVEGSNGNIKSNYVATDRMPLARALLNESKKKKKHKVVRKSKNTMGTWKKFQQTTNTIKQAIRAFSKVGGRKRESGEQKEMGKGTKTGSKKKQKLRMKATITNQHRWRLQFSPTGSNDHIKLE